MAEPQRQFFAFGLGYTAQRLADKLSGEGWHVSGTCRRREKIRKLAEKNIEAFVFDGSAMSDEAAGRCRKASHILLSIPPSSDGDPVFKNYDNPEDLFADAQWIGYLSTTGVYGDRQGGWVDEETPPAPTTERGERRLLAEEQWLSLYQEHDLPVHLFRLPGIYGPGRNQLDRINKGDSRKIVKEGQFFSRIHVDDIIQVLRASMAKSNPGAVYNVCDDEPAPPQDVLDYAADLLGAAPLPEVDFSEAELSEMARSFYSENKRVRNERIKSELGVKLIYPSYREGLKALLRQDQASS